MIKDYDVWTFTDATIAMNQHHHSQVGVYGFVHMAHDIRSNNIFPLAGGFQAISKFNIDILEHCAIYLAMLDIRRIPTHQSICLVTDSNKTYYRLIDAVAVYRGDKRKDWMERLSEGNSMIWNCAQLYATLQKQGYHIDLELCKSHIDHSQQRNWLERDGNLVPSSYARNINIGNNYVDYYVNNIAATGDLPNLQQYSVDQTYLESLQFGYTTEMLRP